MENLINEIKLLYKYFNNENYVSFALFLISILIIFKIENNRKIKDFFVAYSVFILFIIWNPLCIWVLNKFINFGSMYRVYFMLPTIFTIAYAFVKLIENENKIKKFILVVCISVSIVLVGGCICDETNMIKVYNYYKLPDEEVKIAQLIGNDDTTEYKKAMVPYGMSSRIRQISPQIIMAYSRVVNNKSDENGNALPEDTDNPSNYEPVNIFNEGNVENIEKYCKENKINYLVVSKVAVLSEPVENRGFYLYEQTDNYYIYKRDVKE